MNRNYFILPVVFMALLGCTEINKQIKEESKADIVNKIKVELVKNLPNPKVTEDEKGNVFITQDDNTFSLYKDNIFLGDIDGDDEEDVVYSVGLYQGGNMEFYSHFAVVSSINKEIELNLNSSDDIVGISNKKISVISYQWKDDDPRCCPSIKTLKKYSFIGNKIVEVN